MQVILGAIRRAVADYDMIKLGDKIAVGVSGGKDSIALLAGLSRLSDIIGIPYDILAITIDPRFSGKNTDYSEIEKYCSENNIEYVIKRTELGEIIFNIRKEKNPCSLCSRMRHGMLHDIAVENGCNKIALGHNYDDAVETLVMNLFQGGRIGCFQPMTYLSRKDITMIRPLIYLTEKQVRKSVNSLGLPIVKSGCPVDGNTTREETKQFIAELEKTKYPKLRKKIFGALQKSGIDGW